MLVSQSDAAQTWSQRMSRKKGTTGNKENEPSQINEDELDSEEPPQVSLRKRARRQAADGASLQTTIATSTSKLTSKTCFQNRILL